MRTIFSTRTIAIPDGGNYNCISFYTKSRLNYLILSTVVIIIINYQLHCYSIVRFINYHDNNYNNNNIYDYCYYDYDYYYYCYYYYDYYDYRYYHYYY